MDDDFSTRLEGWLNATADRYEVRETLKETPSEITQVVYRRAAKGGQAVGPFVRKVFLGDAGLGSAYEQIMAAQTRGVRLAHLPVVYDTEHDGTAFEVVMEFVHGETLHDLVRRRGAGIDVVRQIAPGLCEATAELHESLDKPVIHRDIKPSNVMIARDRVVLIDLGIARTWHADAPRDTIRYGTPGYAPPEQFGYAQTSVCSDVYALGMTIAFCFTGEEPTAELRERGFADPRIPEPVRAVLVRATQFDPGMRHVSARALAADLEHELANVPSPALRTPDAPTGTPRPSSDPTPGAPATPTTESPVPGAQTPSDPPVNSKANPRPRFTRLGMVWNAFLAIFWGILVIASVAETVRPGEGLTIASYPPWFRGIGFLSVILIPAGCIAYLLCDKRRLRKHPPFAGRTLLLDFLTCLAIVFASFGITLLLYLLFVQ